MLRVVGINLALTIILLAGVEGCVRLTHPEITPMGVDGHLVAPGRFGAVPGPWPGRSGQSYGARVQVDADGFWQQTPVAESTDNPMWLHLGHSVTMGIGVQPELTFSARLAAQTDTAAVRNASLIGYAAADYAVIFRELLTRYPEAIQRLTVFWCLNDAYGPGRGGPGAEAQIRRSTSPILKVLHRRVHTYQWAKARFSDRPLRYFHHDVRYYESDLFDHASDRLRDLATMADAAGIHMDLVVIPYEAQIRSPPPVHHDLPQRRLRLAAEALGIAYLDAREAFSGTADPASFYRYGDGIHLSARGHARLAEYLVEHL